MTHERSCELRNRIRSCDARAYLQDDTYRESSTTSGRHIKLLTLHNLFAIRKVCPPLSTIRKVRCGVHWSFLNSLLTYFYTSSYTFSTLCHILIDPFQCLSSSRTLNQSHSSCLSAHSLTKMPHHQRKSIDHRAVTERQEDLLESGKYSDLTIVCGGKTWNVHRSIVCP